MRLLTATALLFLASPLAGQECRHEARRDARLATSASDRMIVIARAGSLRIEGRPGLSEIRIEGRACASSEDLLERIRLNTERSGDVAHVEVAEIDHDGWNWGQNQYARLDLTIEVPAGMRVDVDDGSGSIIVRGTGDLTIDDGSGEIEVEDIAGSVRIEDGSGSVRLRGVRGEVRIDDGSGGVHLADITGDVSIDDGSGSIDIDGVEGNVRIPDDGTGGVMVRNVSGDLTVRDKGNGSVRYADVRGRVDVPEPRRRGRRR